MTAPAIRSLKMHDLRHTFGSWQIEQGENVLSVSMQMEHKDASITLRVYSHLVRENRPESAARTDAMLFQPFAGNSVALKAAAAIN